jgi:hypothetical protein
VLDALNVLRGAVYRPFSPRGPPEQLAAEVADRIAYGRLRDSH